MTVEKGLLFWRQAHTKVLETGVLPGFYGSSKKAVC